MSEEVNIENAPVLAPASEGAAGPAASTAAQATDVEAIRSTEGEGAAAAEKAPAKKRSTARKSTTAKRASAKKSANKASADGEAPTQSGSDVESEPAVKPKRRARKAKTADEAGTPASPEIIQARALAQVSQASVVRRQRRAAERAAEMVAGEAPVAEVPSLLENPTVPLIDPALRPHRRGRKPKAYIEAEKAAAAALAAQQAALMAARDEQAAASNEAQPKVPASGVQDAESEDVQTPKDAAPKKDARPGRGARAKKAQALDAPASSDTADTQPTPHIRASRTRPRAKTMPVPMVSKPAAPIRIAVTPNMASVMTRVPRLPPRTRSAASVASASRTTASSATTVLLPSSPRLSARNWLP